MKKKINKIFKKKKLKKKDINYVKKCFSLINKGKIRICLKSKNKWHYNNWVKKIVLTYMKIKKKKLIKNKLMCSNDFFKNKLLKKNNKIRFTPLSFVRYGAFLKKNVILMPCFINVGAYINKSTMIDTWSTIGSFAYIGKNVHISGGVGIGGVLEPINQKPVIIENDCFIGARSEIVEGVIIGKKSVISMGVFIGKSTKIYDRKKGIFYNSYIPSNSVVVPGCINYGIYSLYSVIIVKNRDKKTVKKIKINKNLRINND